jgi:hypothetical protein
MLYRVVAALAALVINIDACEESRPAHLGGTRRHRRRRPASSRQGARWSERTTSLGVRELIFRGKLGKGC